MCVYWHFIREGCNTPLRMNALGMLYSSVISEEALTRIFQCSLGNVVCVCVCIFYYINHLVIWTEEAHGRTHESRRPPDPIRPIKNTQFICHL